MSATTALLLGFVLGLKHATDADHLAAVSTIVTERAGVCRSSLVGALWGVGHSLALVPMAILVIVLRVEIGERVANALESAVAVMLIALALNTFRKLAAGSRWHVHVHRHGGRVHLHPHFHAPATAHEAEHDHAPSLHHGLARGIGVRPVLIGMVHGLAGSAALMLLVLATIQSRVLAVIYVAVFALGSTLSMALMSALVGLPLRTAKLRSARWSRSLYGLAGCFSLAVGLTMLYQRLLRGS